MKRPLRLLTIVITLAVIVAIPATVTASVLNTGDDHRSPMSGWMDGHMGMMSQMHASAEDHEQMMQLCAARMEEEHEGMMGGMGMMQ